MAEDEKKMDKLKRKAEEAGESIDEYVKNNPKTALSIAAGVGAVVGMALTVLLNRK